MNISMLLNTDTIFGNGESIPGAEDIAVLTDDCGFPYYKGTTFKGVFREELIRYLSFCGYDDNQIIEKVSVLLGNAGDDEDSKRKLVFSDFTISDNVKHIIIEELKNNRMLITNLFTNLRTFTAINDKGIVEKGSLRTARCVNKGVELFGTIKCSEEDEDLVRDILGMIKYIGTMRNRGFGNVSVMEEKG